MPNIVTEEEVRTKLIYELIRSLGVLPEQIQLERTISIRLGKRDLKLTGRYDFLVKNPKGQNILLIEVKKPNHLINNDDIGQALSYSRLVTGNLVPITIVTNGSDTVILDTINGELLDSIDFKINKINYIQNKKIEELKEEAITILESHSSEIFSEFFKHQLKVNLTPLIGQLSENKKYCEDTYIQFNKDIILDSPEQNVLLITGGPQSGKTNFLINNCLNFQKKKLLCLFYSAYRIKNDLINTIQNDFEKFYGVNILNHFNHFKALTGKFKIVIFVDGLNEVSEKERLTITESLSEYYHLGINIIVSCTDAFKRSIKRDAANNHTIFTNKEDFSEIDLESLNNEAVELAYKRYSSAYSVKVEPKHKKLENIYAISLMMEYYAGKTLPNSVDELQIVAFSIKNKIDFIDKQLQLNSRLVLEDVATKMSLENRALTESEFSELLGYGRYAKCPEQFITAGVLDKNSNNNVTYINFYWDSIRDFLLIDKLIAGRDIKEAIKLLKSDSSDDFFNSALLKYLTYSSQEYVFFINLSPQELAKVHTCASHLIEKQNLISEQELHHYLCCVEYYYDNEEFGLFESSFEHILDSIGMLDVNGGNAAKLARILGMRIVQSGYESVTNYLYDGIFYEMDWQRGELHEDIYSLIAEIGLDGYWCDLYSPEHLFIILQSAIKIKLQKSNSQQLKIISSLVDDIIDYKYNYVSMYCSGPSNLDQLIEEHEHHEGLIEEHISVLRNITDLFKVFEMGATSSTLNELENKLEVIK
jgi:hypothetical protein